MLKYRGPDIDPMYQRLGVTADVGCGCDHSRYTVRRLDISNPSMFQIAGLNMSVMRAAEDDLLAASVSDQQRPAADGEPGPRKIIAKLFHSVHAIPLCRDGTADQLFNSCQDVLAANAGQIFGERNLDRHGDEFREFIFRHGGECRRFEFDDRAGVLCEHDIADEAALELEFGMQRAGRDADTFGDDRYERTVEPVARR